MKPFHEITTDAEYLRAVGMGPETHAELWIAITKCEGHGDTTSCYPIDYPCHRCKDGSLYRLYDWSTDVDTHIHNPDPANKWRDFANVMQVFGPEMDRRGWQYWLYGNGSDPDTDLSACRIWELRHENWTTISECSNQLDHLALLEAFYNAHAQGDAE